MTDQTFTLIVLLAGVVLAAAGVGAIIAIAAAWFARRNQTGLGSDEEFARELLGYQPSAWPMGNGRRDDEDLVP
jgi:hypothetical protein